MGSRKIRIEPAVAENIAAIALYIESKGLVATAEKFADDVYDYIASIADTRKSYHLCKEPTRLALGYKCISYKKKYTLVFIESAKELIVCEFISSKLIRW